MIKMIKTIKINDKNYKNDKNKPKVWTHLWKIVRKEVLEIKNKNK
jgi:hypothetical protein